MATVSNRLVKNQSDKSAQVVEYKVGDQTIKLSPQIVRDYLVSGDKDRVTMQELVMFLNLCKFRGLNPWLKEAYLIKYGSEPATIVTGKEAFEKRAEAHPQHDGHKAGIIVLNADGELERRNGACYNKAAEEIIGGWAEVWRKDHAHSTYIEVSFDEYAGRKKDGSLNRQWASKPATMIRKVALVQALREAFPQTFGGMYSAEESGLEDAPADLTPPADAIPVDPDTGEVVDEQPEPPQDNGPAGFFD